MKEPRKVFPPQSAVNIKISLSEQALVKLLPWLIILSGSAGAGWWISQSHQTAPPSALPSSEIIQPQK